jgi:hypothetical protein
MYDMSIRVIDCHGRLLINIHNHERRTDHRMGRFFGTPENTAFFEKPVFRFRKCSNTEKPKKVEKPKKAI